MQRVWRKAIEELAPYEAGKPIEELRREMGLEAIVKLSTNENPLGPSPRAVEAVSAEVAGVHRYPDCGASELRHALSQHLGVPPEGILCGNGGDEIIGMAALACFETKKEVLIPHPSFEPYQSACRIAGATIVRSPLGEYRIDLADLRGKISRRTQALFLTNPHNPTGTSLRQGELGPFLKEIPRRILVLLDEAYGDFADDPEFPDSLALLRRHPNLLLIRTFSKISGLAGLRVGYAVGHPDLIGWINRVRQPFNVNRLAQVAARAALQDKEHRERSRQLIIGERARVAAQLRALGLTAPPSQANFLLVSVGRDSTPVQQGMLRQGILVRDGKGVGFPGHLRISIGTPEENTAMLRALNRALGSEERLAPGLPTAS